MKRTAQQVAAINDRLRKTGIGGRIMLSESVADSEYFDEILGAMRSFDRFNKDNDPYREHDFGNFDVQGETYCFKIDYYDAKIEFGVDPKTESAVHILTLMHMSER